MALISNSYSTLNPKYISTWEPKPPVNLNFRDIKTILGYFAALPDSVRARICVAGGAAIRPDLADDVDVFLCQNALLEGGAYPTELAEYQLVSHGEQKYGLPGHLVSIYNALYTRPGGAIATKVQVIQTNFFSIDDLLDNFDLSVHAHAIDALGRRFCSPQATMPGEPIVVNGPIQNLQHSYERLMKLRDRYKGMAQVAWGSESIMSGAFPYPPKSKKVLNKTFDKPYYTEAAWPKSGTLLSYDLETKAPLYSNMEVPIKVQNESPKPKAGLLMEGDDTPF